MKKYLFAVFGLLAVPAFAEPPVYYGEPLEYLEEEITVDQVSEEAAETAAPVAPKPAAPSPRANINRAVNRVGATPQAAAESGRATPSRAVASRAAVTGASATGNNNAAVQRSRAASAIANADNAAPATRRAAAQAPDANTARAAMAPLVQSDTVNNPLYIPSGARVSVRTPVTATRGGTIRSATGSSASLSEAEMISGPTMEEVAQLSDFCKAQYFACMDGFCAVLDDNQGRCSCSSNITKYKKVEDALKEATEQLQDIAAKIQYIGLTTDEVKALFTATEAELAMQSTPDSTQLKNDLDKIRRLVVDIKPENSFGSEMGLDFSNLLDFNLGLDFDLSTLFTDGGQKINNQRGAELYKTASTRCKSSVLENCRKQGIDINVIINGYDLEIDRQCMVYERNLEESNTNMRRTVRNATTVLQRARLVVAQNRNTYDAKGCVNALDSCMQNEFVCGSDYENCLDPTGKFIVNGQIVAGSTPGLAPTGDLFKVWNYGSSNAWTTGDLSGLIATIPNNIPSGFNGEFSISGDGGMLKSMLNKIGYIDADGRVFGMCASVLNKCQNLTFTSVKPARYYPNNTVVKEFLNRTFMQIKARQETVLADFAETCVTDSRSCLLANGAVQATDTLTAQGNVPTATQNACESIMKTCASVLSGTTTITNVITAAICYNEKSFNTTSRKCDAP